MSSDGYDRMLELIAENPGLEAEELVETATKEGLDAEDAHEWLKYAEVAGDVLDRNDKYWIVRKGKFAYDEFDHPV